VGLGILKTLGDPNSSSEPLRQAESISHVSVVPETIVVEPYDERKCDANALVGMARPMATSDATAATTDFFMVKPLKDKDTKGIKP
jgi:hypothetical protein